MVPITRITAVAVGVCRRGAWVEARWKHLVDRASVKILVIVAA